MSVQWASSRAIELLNEFKLKGFVGNDWHFGWNRCKSAFGLCRYDIKQISLSYHYAQVGSYEQIEDTIRHEIAHIISGCNAGHGILWKRACLITGAKPIRCGKIVPNMPSKYQGYCPTCSHVYKANRVLKEMNRRLCCKKGCTARHTKKFIKWRTN